MMLQIHGNHQQQIVANEKLLSRRFHFKYVFKGDSEIARSGDDKHSMNVLTA